MPNVESDTLTLADGNVGGSVESLAVANNVAFSAVYRPAGISRAGIRLLPNSESAVEKGESPGITDLPGEDSRCSPTQHEIVVTPPMLESRVDYLVESPVAAVSGEWRQLYLATVGYQNAEFTTDPDLFAETGNLSDSAVICA